MHTSSLQIACLVLSQLSPSGDPALQPVPLGVVPLQPIATQDSVLRRNEPTPAKPRELNPAPAVPLQPMSDGGSAVFDRNVAPTSAMQPLAPSEDESQKSLAELILHNALRGENAQLPRGASLSLRDALRSAADRQRQLDVVRAYWRLGVSAADYHHAQEEAALLAELISPRAVHEQAQLRAAQAQANARRDEAKLAYVDAQHDLADKAARTSDDLPTASDLPFVGVYNTRFSQVFAGRVAPASLRRIDRTLPHSLHLIQSRASAVAAAENALQELATAYDDGRVDATTVLEAVTAWRDQRIAFLATVRDYNSSIAEYALHAAGSVVNQDQIVSMLIETEPRTRSVLAGERDVLPASGQQPIANAPRTAAPVSPSLRTGELTPVDPPSARLAPADDTQPARQRFVEPTDPPPSRFLPPLSAPPTGRFEPAKTVDPAAAPRTATAPAKAASPKTEPTPAKTVAPSNSPGGSFVPAAQPPFNAPPLDQPPTTNRFDLRDSGPSQLNPPSSEFQLKD